MDRIQKIIIISSRLIKVITITYMCNMSHFKSGKSCPKIETNTCPLLRQLLTKPDLTLTSTLVRLHTTRLQMVQVGHTQVKEFKVTWVSMEFLEEVGRTTCGSRTLIVTQGERAIQLFLRFLKVIKSYNSKPLKRSTNLKQNHRCPYPNYLLPSSSIKLPRKSRLSNWKIWKFKRLILFLIKKLQSSKKLSIQMCSEFKETKNIETELVRSCLKYCWIQLVNS